jgi:YHS domain-containing protein/thioredoxin-related protein
MKPVLAHVTGLGGNCMMRTAIVTIVATTLFVLTGARAHAERWYTDYEAARSQAKQLNQPMLLHFYADWCFPCKRMEQDVLSRPAVLQVLSSRMLLVKINVDHHPQLAQRFHVSQFPSDVVVDPKGERILSSTGYMEADKYVAFARQAEQQFSGSRAIPAAPSERVESEAPKVMIAMEGYCPVTLATERSWVKGSSQFASEHRGQVYYLASKEQKDVFIADPRDYVPQLLGCDPVILRDTDLAVPGSVRYGAFYDDELYLFSSQENRGAFKSEPERYTRTRIVRSADEIDQTVLR